MHGSLKKLTLRIGWFSAGVQNSTDIKEFRNFENGWNEH
jgi:hypothetical protein